MKEVEDIVLREVSANTLLIEHAHLSRASSPPNVLLISAGHGTHIKDLNGDEDDGRDEAIVPAGCKADTESELLIDDVIFEEVRARISCHGVYLTLTLTLNLPYVGIG